MLLLKQLVVALVHFGSDLVLLVDDLVLLVDDVILLLLWGLDIIRALQTKLLCLLFFGGAKLFAFPAWVSMGGRVHSSTFSNCDNSDKKAEI